MNVTDYTIIAALAGNGGGGGGAGGGGYDLVIRCDKYIADGITDDDLTLVKGSYADCAAKIQAGEPISAQVYTIETSDGVTYFYEYHIFAISADIGYHDDVSICISSLVLPMATVKSGTGVNIDMVGSVDERNTTWLYVSESGVTLE